MTSETKRVTRRHWWGWVATVLLVGALAGAAGWAMATLLRPATDPLEASDFTYATVEAGEVGASINLSSSAEWTPDPVGSNQASGVVTGVSITSGDEVDQGATLYEVNQRPVVVAQGDVPAFRALGDGSEGQDVAQLQQMLASLGFFSSGADGKAGKLTVSAIKAWQKSLGVAVTGTVELGDVIFVPALPTRISLDIEVISRGKSVAGGEQVVGGLPAAPTFTLPVTEAQASMVPTGTPVQLTSPQGTLWDAFAGDSVSDAQSQTVLVTLTAEEGQVICRDKCTEVPVAGKALLPAKVTTVPVVKGLVVPSSALVTTGSAQLAVINQTGTLIPVTVVASAKGMSVVEGVEAGARVRVPAKEDSAR